MRTATTRMQAVVPIEKPRILTRPSIVPIAIASSRKISGAVEMIHLTVSMAVRSRNAFERYSGSVGIGERLIQINPLTVIVTVLSVDAGFATPMSRT